ncbi:N-acetylmuramic acid 6-phosphate etherase [Candidatus Obscuribacterales bacterium]|nr:N-acetylmuramic acid 6-phosphate etherase [Candidatus Obscuribacterales bacterium]MBX3152897.1 N-acetylmuramic acid 6-phosphate etherase [Candidatus Obscuribacterales bacterium]
MGYTTEFTRPVTEERNDQTMDLDLLNTSELVERVQAEDLIVAQKVKEVVPDIAKAVDIIVEKLRAGGRLIYFGAGTSGRIGVLDAAECPPTFGATGEQVIAYIAGGKEAMFNGFEDAEDATELGAKDAEGAKVGPGDAVIGITASGRTPYVVGALNKAKELGAATIMLVNNPNPELAAICDISITVIVGPEALSGCTRMKAGTAQKMVLNLISTCSMVRLGKVYENLMVDLQPTNEKLRERAVSIISLLGGVPRHLAEGALVASHEKAKTAILMVKRKVGRVQAEELLERSKGSLRNALIADAEDSQ